MLSFTITNSQSNSRYQSSWTFQFLDIIVISNIPSITYYKSYISHEQALVFRKYAILFSSSLFLSKFATAG